MRSVSKAVTWRNARINHTKFQRVYWSTRYALFTHPKTISMACLHVSRHNNNGYDVMVVGYCHKRTHRIQWAGYIQRRHIIIIASLKSQDIQIEYGLSLCVNCPSMGRDPGSLNPGMRRSRLPGWWDPGIRTNTGAGDTVLAIHT